MKEDHVHFHGVVRMEMQGENRLSLITLIGNIRDRTICASPKETKRERRSEIMFRKAVASIAVASMFFLAPVVSTNIAYAEEPSSANNVSSQISTPIESGQYSESPDGQRAITVEELRGSVAISSVKTIPGDQLIVSENRKMITWLSPSGETVAVLDATSGGNTPLNWFTLSGNHIELHFFKDRSACGKSYAGAASFGVAWELGVCTPLGVAFLPAGIACGVGSALLSPLIPWDKVCKG